VSLPWDEPGWLDRATDWIDERVERTGEVELERRRPWSALARVPTADGVLWFKENPRANAFEPVLTGLLAARRADAVPEVVAAEGPRMLTRHIGPQLREVLDSGETEPGWEEVLALYAELQLDFMPLVGDALAAGTPDERPPQLPELYEELVGRDGLYSAVAEAAAALGDAVPATVVHQEAHDANVFVRGGRPVFLDWAEASVSHPFTGPLLALRSATERAGYEPGSREVERLRDVYLEPFTRFATMPELREAFRHAYLLAPIGRARVWHRILNPLGPEFAEGYGDSVAAWLEIQRGIADGSIALGGA
jgi:phosphotransferase family enzyme